VLSTALLDLYAKCGKLDKAQEVFEALLVQDVVAWNALIAGYAQHGLGYEAIKCFEQMRAKNITPDSVTFISIVKACGSLGYHTMGEEIHVELENRGLLQRDLVLSNALVDMYGKCGFLMKSQEVFDSLLLRDAVSWNVLMAGYAQMGGTKIVLELFRQMRGEEVEPNVVTLLILLTVCSHAGLVEEGKSLFSDMYSVHGLSPSLEHYTCVIDLFGRAGQLDEAKHVLDNVPSHDHLPLFMALLGACHKWVNVNHASWVFEQLVKVDRKYAASAYVSMRNIYAAASMQAMTGRMNADREKKEILETSGSCWIDQRMNVHSFMVNDMRHLQSISINAKLEDILEKISSTTGYSLDPPSLTKSTVENGINGQCDHAVMLAIACALINTPLDTSIHVVNNMRVCANCHIAISHTSRVEKRTILVKDPNLLHVFKDGTCVC
jgi:pentatricopeptide repeat protein